jgi:hypothetical protein
VNKRRFLVTFRQPVAVPINGTPVFTSCLIVESPLENNEGKPLKEVADNRWKLAHTNQFKAISLGDGRVLSEPIDCMIGGFDMISFAVELPASPGRAEQP